MISGKYKVYIDGKCVAEKENSITLAGRSIILKSIMGLIPTIGGYLQVGTSTKPNTQDTINTDLISDNKLGFAVAAAPVMLSYLDNSGNFDAMVFKTTLSASGTIGERYYINELGLFPGKPDDVPAEKMLLLFDGSGNDNWYNGTTVVPIADPNITTEPTTSSYISSSVSGYSFKIGNLALFLKNGETLKSTRKFTELPSYGDEDSLVVAYSKISSETPTINIRFYTNQLNYFTTSISTTSGQTYEIKDVLVKDIKSSASTTGTPSWSDIQYITVSLSGSGDIVLDGVRFNDNDNLDTTYGMVSRTVLDTPLLKENGSVMDIEYYLSIAFNKTVV